MKKILIIFVLIIVLGALALIFGVSRAPEDLVRAGISNDEQNIENENGDLKDVTGQVSVSNLDFKFEGFGPGKSHIGTFNKISISDVKYDTKSEFINEGKITFYSNSLNINPEILNEHLCAENFFDCENYQEVTFKLTNVNISNTSEIIATGDLTFKQTTKSISFPIKLEDGVVSADFAINMAEFGFIAPGIVDDEVRIFFNTPYPNLEI